MITASEMGERGGKKSVQSRFKNLSKEEISAKMKAVRNKKKPMTNEEKNEIIKALPLYFEFGDSDRPAKIVSENNGMTVYIRYGDNLEIRNDLFFKLLQKGYRITKEEFDKRMQEFKEP